MRKFCSGLAAFVLTVAGWSACTRAQADEWGTPDKPKHLAVSAAMAGAFVAAGMSERQAFAASLAVGLAKELHDSRRGGSGFSGKDLAADALGAYMGAKLGGVIIRRNFVGYTWKL
jgi:putative lipoprotein